MKKILMTLLTAAVAVPIMFAADAPKADTNAPATKTAKKKHHSKKKNAAATTTPAATPAK